MSEFTLATTSAFGIESVLADELKKLGFVDLVIENGRVTFKGDMIDIARCNVNLRCADRVLIEISRYSARDFDDLFQGCQLVPWEDIVPANGKIDVNCRLVKSTINSVTNSQSVIKKSVIGAMKRRYKQEHFSEDGPAFRIDVLIEKDEVRIFLDTSGPGLHKRGYRKTGGTAPIRETLAAALVYISRWSPDRIMADPLCGSGTIAIEAALIGRNIAPGINRKFIAEKWSWVPEKIWKSSRDEAMDHINDNRPVILASDSDFRSFKTARDNAEIAGVGDIITFQKKPVEEFKSRKKYGCIISNPPYAVRLSDKKNTEMLYRTMGKVFSELPEWSYFILTANTEFQKFFGRNPDKNRKLYNGKIKCYLYQYFGELPPRGRIK